MMKAQKYGCWVHGVATALSPRKHGCGERHRSYEKEAGQLFKAVKPEHAGSILSVSAVKMRPLVFDKTAENQAQ